MKNCIKFFAGSALFAVLAFTACKVEVKLTQEQMVSQLDEDSKSAVFDEVLAGKNAEELLVKLSDEQKSAIYDKMFTDEKLSDTEKAAIFDELLKTKTNKDFIVGIITKEGNEALYADVKAYITGKLTKAELVALLEAADTSAPGEVTNLAASASPKGNEIVLTWTDGTDTDKDLYGYLVSWKEAPDSRSIAALAKDSMMVAKSSNEDKSNGATVTGLTAGTKYSFTVQAIDLTGNKSTGVSVEATPVETSVTVSETGTYTVYHFHQSDSGSVAMRDYYRDSTEENKNVEKGSTLETLKKDYPGFTAKVLTQFGSSIYVFYDRNTITYTFNAGSEGKFEDDTTSKEVSGLYGTRFSEPRTPKREGYRFIKWQNESDTELPNTFGAEDISWTAVWAEGTEITLTCNVCGETHIIDVEGCNTWTDIINKNPYVSAESGFVIYKDETHSGDIHRNGYGFYYTSTFMDGGTFTIDRPWY